MNIKSFSFSLQTTLHVMASSVSPYFILSPKGANKTKNEEETNEDKEKSSKNGKKEKGYKNKHVVLTRNELTRKRMDLIRTKLEESRARYFEKLKDQALNCSRPIPRVSDVFTPINKESLKDVPDDDGNATEMVPISNTGQLPYVYFVVAPEKQIKPIKAKSRNKERRNEEEKRKQLATRSTVFASKEDYGIANDKKMMSLARDFGIQSDSFGSRERSIAHKQIVFPLPIKLTPKNPPTTPATTILSNSAGYYGSREFDHNDFETIYEKPVKMTICDNNEIVEAKDDVAMEMVPRRMSSTRSMSTRCLELPFISLDEQRKALGTAGSYGQKSLDFVRKSISQDSSQKRVHFADSVDLPSIKGSQIALPTESLFPYCGPRALTVPDFSSEKSKSISDLYHTQSLPETRALHTSDGRRKNCKTLDLPRIDIVSTVYDELIIKAIQAYILTLPPYSKQSSVARQLLEQLENKTISTADLDKEQFRVIREDIAKMPRNIHSKGRFQKPTLRKSGTEEKCYSPLEPKCYRMILPGALPPPGPKLKIIQS